MEPSTERTLNSVLAPADNEPAQHDMAPEAPPRSSMDTLPPPYEDVDGTEPPTDVKESFEVEEQVPGYSESHRNAVSSTSIPHPMRDSKVLRETHRFSLALSGQAFFVVSPWRIHHNLKDIPATLKGGKSLRHRHHHVSQVSLGSILDSSDDDSADRIETYCAAFSDGSWTSRLAAGYPELTGHIDRLGIDDLEFCVLGPAQMYLARWVPRWPMTERTWVTNAPSGARAYLQELQDCGEQPLSVAFGHGRSWFIACDTRGGYCTCVTYRFNLNGFYPDLVEFISSMGGPSRRDFVIEAIALNPASETDFVMVYRKDWKPQFYLMMRVSDPTLAEAIAKWWNGEMGDTSGINLVVPLNMAPRGTSSEVTTSIDVKKGF